MRSIFLSITALAVVSFAVDTVSAPAANDRTDRAGFNYGGAPEYDSPPLAKNDNEKQALAALGEMTRENFKKAGVENLITIIEGDAHETVKQHTEPIDVVFLDAEKKGYVDYLRKLLPLVRPGGLILGHDMHRPMPDQYVG